jgi:hypothetical protein
MKTSGEKPSCIRFTVARPYLLSGKCAKDNRGTSNNCTEFEQPYFRPAGQNVVVFGIVDEDLPILIGRDNRSWRNEHAKFKTELTALEPALALEQAWQCFVKTENLDADKLKTFRKVLLAQMPREKAEELASHVDIDFDLVITAPTRDLAHASSTGHLTIEPLPNEDSPREDQRPQCPRCPTYRSVVIVPMGGQERSSSDCRQDQDTTIDPVQEITVSDALSSHSPWEPVRKVRIAATRRSFSSKPHEAACLREDLDGLAKPDVVLPSGENQYFITRVLKILREKTNTDAALMQKRDFYWGPFLKYQDPNKTPVSPPNAEKIDRVLWKGDVLNVLIVKGSALRKALKESQEFDHLDKQSTKRVDEPFRGLLYFGIAPTDDDDYLIDGTLLDDDRLYTIATTNHIASGDTGYPELNDPELADTRLHNPQKTEKIGQQISKLVCEALKQDHCIAAPPDAPIGSNALFASADARPAQETPNSAVRLKDWFRTSLNEPLISYEPRISQQHVQDRRTWTLALDSASVGYKLVTNNLSEADHQTFLGGITEPGVSAPNSRSWTFTTQARLLDAGKWIDAYIRHQSEYSNQVTQQKQGLPISTYDKNRSVLDAGLFIHPFHVGNHFWSLFSPGGRKSEPKSGFVLEPLRWDSPIRTENLVITHPDKTQEILPLQYTWRLFMRAGLRFENTKSHLEAGTEAGWTHGALLGIHTATGVTCFPNPAQSVQDCLNGLTPPLDPIHQDRTLKTEHGLYIDWNWSEKIWYGWKMIFQDQGEWFPFNASKDNSADTRYRNNLIYKLSLPIFANFSFQPGIEYFSYENKFGDRTLSRWTPTASLDYSFDHHSGGKWKKSLAHKPGGSDSSSGKQ